MCGRNQEPSSYPEAKRHSMQGRSFISLLLNSQNFYICQKKLCFQSRIKKKEKVGKLIQLYMRRDLREILSLRVDKPSNYSLCSLREVVRASSSFKSTWNVHYKSEWVASTLMKGLNSLTPSSIHDGHQPQSSELSPPQGGTATGHGAQTPQGGMGTGHGARSPQGGTATGHEAQSPSGRDGHQPRSSVPLGEGWPLATSSVPLREGKPPATELSPPRGAQLPGPHNKMSQSSWRSRAVLPGE